MIKKSNTQPQQKDNKIFYKKVFGNLFKLTIRILLAPIRFAARKLSRGFETTQTPIVPSQSVSGTALIAVIAIMSFLACLTLAAVTMIFEQARLWENDVSSELTVQIRPVDGINIDNEVIRTVALIEQSPGIGKITPLDAKQSAALLEPWLGSGLALSELPIPRLIVLEVSNYKILNTQALRSRLTANIAGASLDDHSVWIRQLKRIANITIATGIGIFLLVLIAAALSVVFATRGAMAGNQAIISVLHFIGAEDRFIAQEFQHRFLFIGLKGGGIGSISALLFFIISGNLLSFLGSPTGTSPFETLFGSFSLSPLVFVGFGFVLMLVATLTAITTRMTVERYIDKIE